MAILKSETSRNIFSLFKTRWAIGCVLSLAVMEIISASSSLWLVMIMDSITAGIDFTPILFCYLGALLLPSIPWCFAYIFKTSWRQEAQRSFINIFVNSNKSNVNEWNNKSVREHKMSILTSEGPQAITALIDYAFDVSSYTLSVIFNITALSIIVEPLFTLAFLTSLFTVALVMKIRRRVQKRLTHKALAARIDLGQSLLGAWDNVLLGNSYNFKLWEEKTQARINRCLSKNITLERFDQMMMVTISFITMVPSLLVVVWFVYKNQHESSKLASFFVTIPILFLILSYTYQLLSNAFRWGIHKSKLTSLFSDIHTTPADPVEMSKNVKWSKMHYTKKHKKPHSDLAESRSEPPIVALNSHFDLIEHSKEPGRITLRGENGSGKSCTLMLIKQSLGQDAFILPSAGKLYFAQEISKLSSGENLKECLTEIFEKVEASVLLLDDWDANLDLENRDILSQLIDQIAEKKCVIEVRNR